MYSNKVNTELAALGYTGSVGDKVAAYLKDATGLNQSLDDMLANSYDSDVATALYNFELDARDGAIAISYTYATWNPSDAGIGYTFSNENRTVSRLGAGNNSTVRATLPKTSGKWYYEITWPTGIQNADGAVALASSGASVLFTYPGAVADSILYVAGADGNPIVSPRFAGAELTAQLIPTGQAGTITAVAIDLDARKAWIAVNGTYNNGPVSNSVPPITWSETFPIYIAQRLYFQNATCTLNAGQEPFVYPVPTGFNPGWYA